MQKNKKKPMQILPMMRIPIQCYANVLTDVARRVKAREDTNRSFIYPFELSLP